MKKLWKKHRVVVTMAVIIVVITGIYGYKEYTRKLPDTHTLKATFKLTAGDLLRQFEADEFKATAQYSDRVIMVQGIIGSIQTSDFGGTIFLNNENSITSVICQFDQKDFKEIPEMHKGESISIKGICSGYLMEVVMVRCVIE